jgi:hypothetical protein
MQNRRQPIHISLPERKALICRFMAFSTYEDYEASDVSNRLSRLRDHILTIADQAIDTIDDTHLDRWLGRVAGNVSNGLSTLGVEKPTLTMKRMAARFEKNCQQICCKTCVAKTAEKKICNGSTHDASTVDAGGDCIHFIRALFEAARDISQAYYDAFAGDAFKIKTVEVTFSTEVPSSEKLLKMAADYAVDGATGLEDNGRFAVSTVKLFLNVQKFDWPTYLATFYVLLHELVCHAFVAPATKTKRPASVPYDAYAEGWMDYVVNIILGELETNAGPASKLGKRLPSVSMYGVGRGFHNYRSNPATGGAALKQGVKAARAAYDALQDILPEDEARSAMLRLSFQLNSFDFSAFPVGERVELTRILARHLDRKVPKYKPQKAKITRHLKHFAREPDARKFYLNVAGL